MAPHVTPRAAIALLLAAGLNAGCQAASPTGGPLGLWRLGVAGSAPAPVAAAVPAAASPMTTAVEPAIAPAAPIAADPAAPIEPPRRSGGGRRSAPAEATPAATGRLVVDLAPMLTAFRAQAGFRLLATTEDVDAVVVTVSMAGQPDRVTTLTRAELDAGTTTVAVPALPTGTCTVTIVAKRADGVAIGTSSRAAAIGADRETAFSVGVYMVPDDGEGYDWRERLVIGVELAAADPNPAGEGPAAGTVLERLATHSASPLQADGHGTLYTPLYVMNSGGPAIAGWRRWSLSDGASSLAVFTGVATSPRRVPPGPLAYDPIGGRLLFGTSLPTAPMNTETVAGAPRTPIKEAARSKSLVVDAAGVAYFDAGGLVWTFAGTTAAATAIPTHSAVAIDAAGTIWTNEADGTTPAASVRRYDAAGTLLGATLLPLPAAKLRRDPVDGVWVTDRTGGQLVHVHADGTADAPLGVPTTDFCFDAAGNLWIAGPDRLYKLSPAGLQLGAFPIKAMALAAGDGFIFAGVGTALGGEVLKILP